MKYIQQQKRTCFELSHVDTRKRTIPILLQKTWNDSHVKDDDRYSLKKSSFQYINWIKKRRPTVAIKPNYFTKKELQSQPWLVLMHFKRAPLTVPISIVS